MIPFTLDRFALVSSIEPYGTDVSAINHPTSRALLNRHRILRHHIIGSPKPSEVTGDDPHYLCQRSVSDACLLDTQIQKNEAATAKATLI